MELEEGPWEEDLRRPPVWLLANFSSSFLLCFLALTPSLRPYLLESVPPECVVALVAVGAFALCGLMGALIRPRPDKPVGRRFKLLLETACLQAALLLRHYYYGHRDSMIGNYCFFGLMASASFQVYAVCFAFLRSPDVGVSDALFVVLTQSLVYWAPARGCCFFVALLACGLLIVLRYHRPSPPESSCWVSAHTSTVADYSNADHHHLSAPFIC